MNDFDVVVIGAGPIGMQIARRLSTDGTVCVIDCDPDSPGATEARAQLLQRLARQPQSLERPIPARSTPGLTVRPATWVIRIARDARRVETERGESIGYGRLVLALGSQPVRPAFAAHDSAVIQFAYRRSDISALANTARTGERVTILGAGLLAVELAAALAARTQVTLVVRSRLLRGYAEATMSQRIARHLRALGVRIYSPRQVAAVTVDATGQRVRLDDGLSLRADRLVLACGTRANTALAAAAGLTVDDGIRVDGAMRTADPAIVAVGDCAQPPEGPGQGSVARGIDQVARALATIRHGEARSASQSAWPREIRLGRLKFLCLSRPDADRATHARTIARYAWRRAYALTFENERIVACSALLRAPALDRLRALVERDAPCGPWQRWQLRVGRIPSSSTPSARIVCHCAGVTRGEIEAAVDANGANLEAIRDVTSAGRYCGGCVEAVEGVIAGGRPRRALATFFSGSGVALLVAAGVWLPPAAPGASVQGAWFKLYTVLTSDVARQVSGYTMLAFIALALWAVASRRFRGRARGRWLHLLYGGLAVVCLPVHSLGGALIGGGLNALLNPIFLICVAAGVAVWLRRQWQRLLFLHSLLTAVLLAALVLHVVYVYQY